MSSPFDIDAQAGTVDLEVPTAVYTQDALQIAAHIFSKRADVYMAEDNKNFEVTIKAKRKSDAAALRTLGGEFLNELLNQEYRVLVTRFNSKVTNMVLTQSLFSARGGETPPEKADESAAEFKADVKKMMDEAREEIKRTMPKKIAPQGIPMTLPKEEGG